MRGEYSNFYTAGMRGEYSLNAGVAQLVEQLICNQRVEGSNPFASYLIHCFIMNLLCFIF